jgi:hypothetical protein
MHEHLTGPMLDVVVVMALAGTVTLVCFVAMFWMLFRPGETDRDHPKYEILNDDR